MLGGSFGRVKPGTQHSAGLFRMTTRSSFPFFGGGMRMSGVALELPSRHRKRTTKESGMV